MLTLPDSPTSPTGPEATNVYYDIEEALVNSAAETNSEEFLPIDQIDILLTEQRIASVLAAYRVDASNDLISYVLSSARRVFLILAHTYNVRALPDLCSQGFRDEYLPLEKTKEIDEFGMPRRVVRSVDESTGTARPERWPAFTRWLPVKIDSFLSAQWLFLAPTFGKEEPSFHRTFHKSRPLPFVHVARNSYKTGHFSSVYKTQIHHAHANPEIFHNFQVAVKVFKPNPKDHFHRELETLKKLRHLDDKHLIKPIAAYEIGTDQCFLFPWTDGGNLRDYWRENGDKKSLRLICDESLVSWTLTQMRGLCRCLKLVFGKNCRHGDLKPENILYAGGRGNFLIADFGLSKFHDEVTSKRERSSSMKYGTRRYEAPEVYMDGHKPRSRDYDIWSMGGILLEWLIWLVEGHERLLLFNTISKFWESSKGEFQVDYRVQESMKEMAQRLTRDTALMDILELVRDRLLIVELVEDGGHIELGRAKATELSDRMEQILARAEREPSYRYDPKVWRHSKKLGRVGSTLKLPDRRHVPKEPIMSPTISECDYESSEDDGVTDNNLPSINIERTGSTNTESLPLLPPDEYSNRQRSNLNDIWESEPDHEFAQALFKQVEWATMRPPLQTEKLCNRCKDLNIWTNLFRLPYDMVSLRQNSSICNLCKLFHQTLLGTGIDPESSGTLVRVGSTFKSDPKGPSIISIYHDPEYQSPSPHSQLGFPQLPPSASSAEFSLLRQWLQICDKTHKCRPIETDTTKMPTRVIDLGDSSDPSLRLVETGETSIFGSLEYVALSHCWGNMPENKRFCTYRRNIVSHKQSMDMNKLPRSFQDAVTVTRALNIRYLWIDSVCIIQEDQEDWEAEAGNMENVFSSAYCILAASCASSSLEGFLHARELRPCVAVSTGSSKLYFCKTMDDFHGDVENSVLNRRGWVLQERVLARRTIHFTSNQIYWECGKGVHCETLAKLHNSKAEFLGDSDFPHSALKYFREDRSMGILGLERRLARTFKTEGDYGILKRYLQRSLMWKREGRSPLRQIEYPEDRKVPSWSWMAYSGGITYVSAPFDGVKWYTDDIRTPFDSGPLRRGSQNRDDGCDVELEARVKSFNSAGDTVEILKRISFDDVQSDNLSSLRCVVLGKDKGGPEGERSHYVLVIKALSVGVTSPIYKRVGIGSLLASHISFEPAGWVRIQ